MQTTIDSAGRIVIPKALRDRLGLTPGGTIELRERDAFLEIEAAPTPMKLRRGEHGLVAVPDADLPPLTGNMVRDAVERSRR